MDIRKKHKLQTNDAYPHNGSFLQKYFETNKINRAELARKLNVSGSSVFQYMSSQSLQLGILWKISLVLQHNFVAELGDKLPVSYKTKREQELEERISELENELKKAQLELSVYQKIMNK